MVKEINRIQDRIIEEFSTCNDWIEKYEYVIKKGKSLGSMDEQLKNDENSIGGCQSNVWIYGEMKNDTIHYSIDSDSLIVKGLISLLLEIVNDRSPEDISQANLYFMDVVGLNTHLSPSRLNGLQSIIKHIKEIANDFVMSECE
ncbi:MAG: SufE family protein [Candidatus Thermoplasmatota archaeon]|nr:SufE family protein [Candidatus Thermoplasmatota archaeon]